MCKFILALFIAFFSVNSLPVMAANCTGGSITFGVDPSDKNYWRYTYSSANNDPLLITRVTITDGNMTCAPDYMDYNPQSQMIMRITSGGTCKNGTIITTPYPGIEWQLEGMRCNNANQIISDTIKSGGDSSQRISWPVDTVLGKARLLVTDEYWRKSTQSGQYSVTIPALSLGKTLTNSPEVDVRSYLGPGYSFIFKDTATCAMSLSTENLDFGRLTPSDVNGNSFYKELSVHYDCQNKALVNGLYVRFAPENVVDSANGMFSANDNEGRKLNFQMKRVYGDFHTVPLNTNYKVYEPTNKNVAATATFRIYVKPSSPFPTGKVSTNMNVSLIYR
ncbi:fimbrial protein [Escherichia coli]|nr:fimbrial protein [Escherichia coli]EGI3961148.1 fimbrial protein [Escherichia coli]EGI3975513.1 fimbrial protein [Escherichia coli]EGI3984789.1 fimbrial protein [Escherichia coli]